ncbi:MAG: putative toxin-antitoxin system toxin component, PIN family [Flexibacter sp. CG_4_10_14_3_um_filter_32_15]|nr:MAG: putative toxin-antitoxin system toxin component, PIN family [Flexibacter sp. CG_4_10_14_3_um_filter_32_15]
MKTVIDTNILLISVSPNSPFRWVFDAFLQEKYTLCVTTEILSEYDEIIAREANEELASLALQIIENAVNTEFITRYYKWNLIYVDEDDNKFVDCAVAANADFIVTSDKHFNILKEIPFPKVKVISLEDFKKLI